MEEETRKVNAERMTESEKFREIETEYRHDDFLEVEDSLDSKEESPHEEKVREEEERLPIQDWEKEAKKKIRIKMDDPSMRRRTIYDLNSYASSRPSVSDIWKFNTTQITTEPSKKIRYSASMRIPGLVRLNLSPLTQKIVGCIIGEDVTTEYPWVHVRKEIIEDNIDLHSESSDFLPVKNEIHAFPTEKIFIGYAPSVSEEGQFYIVGTEEGRDTVVKHIQEQREEHENRVRNAIYRLPNQWLDLGSGTEVDANIVQNTRPLFEIEVLSTADLLNASINLTDRKVDDQADGYIELLPNNQQIFENVQRKLVSRYAQVTPSVRHNEAQTAPSIPVNSWHQYLYEYETVDLSTYTVDKIKSLKDFLKRYTGETCDRLLINSTWDIYTNDYANLVRSEKDTQAPVPIGYEERRSYYDGKIIADKVINDLSWHPFWTGTAVVAYTQHAKNEHLIGPKTYNEVSLACECNNRVLIWSFADCLSPKLVLDCPREVTSVTVCPLDSSIIVGGCANGQIAIWHIPGKIEQVETVVAQTSAQARYSAAMKSLMTWMRETTATSLISPTAMSALKYSQKAGITQIVWVPSHHKVDKNGRISSLPENAALNDLSYQFVTASKDGTIAFWDLKSRPSQKDISQAILSRRKRKIHPDILKSMAQPTSPFKLLDRVFKPDYILVIQYPDESRQLVITTLSMYNPKFRKEQVEPFPVARDDLTIRKYYKPIIEKANYAMEPKMLIGTVEGDFGCITWAGYEFATDVNRETARWLWTKRVHDGPVTHAVRSNYYHQTVATVGGKIFAIWRDDFGEPLVWKKSNVGYSTCSWGILRPTVLILGRMDGTVEIWDLIMNSHKPSFVQSPSGRIITGIYTHELPLEPQCLVLCDFNGSLRMFTAPRVLLTYDVGDVEWLKKFIDRQVQRRRKPWQFLEEAKERWMSMEVKRMQRVILEKKGLRKDVLERQRAPVLRLWQEARTKKRKIREILNLQDEIFEETVALLFPERQRERRETLLPPLPVSAADRRLTIDEFIKKETAPRKEDVFADPEEEIMYNFLEVQAEALAKLKTAPYERTFDWRKVLAQGKLRRRSMDIELKKLNRPRKTCKVDDAVNDASRLAAGV
ncbi:hypothetical protein PUN28_007420 [Cardiocondyla obscurior]|uniref:WD repeat-containing protein 63 n=1 Tax=Cardiocondyla obscurior TaxID=286306 RepID=A0AAW2G917_9HYME